MSLLGKLFNSNKKDTSYNGPRPVQSLEEVGGGKEYKQTIMDRLMGRNVGFGEDYASVNSSPIVKNMRSQFTDYTMPELTSELSVTGRRRGSGGFDQVKRAYNDEANQEGDVFSRLQVRNEDQKRNEINDALGRVGDYASNEANLVSNRANFDYTDNARQAAEANARRANEASGLQALGRLGTSVALAPFTGGASLLSASSAFGGGGSGGMDMGTYLMIQNIMKRNQIANSAQRSNQWTPKF